MTRLAASIARLWRDRGGATALEFAFVAPILIMVLAGIVQVGGLFFLQNQMASVAQDASRRVAVGQFSAGEAQTYAESKLINWGVTFTVTVTEPGQDAQVNISVPLAQAAVFDLLGVFQSGDLRAEAVTRKM